MTILEIYCDGCDEPSPSHAMIGGMSAGQRIRQLLPEYQQLLRERHGWTTTRGGEDLCKDCSLKRAGSRDPVAGWAKIDGDDAHAASLPRYDRRSDRALVEVSPPLVAALPLRRISGRGQRALNAIRELHQKTGDGATVMDIAAHLGRGHCGYYEIVADLCHRGLVRGDLNQPRRYMPADAIGPVPPGTEFIEVDW